MNAPEVWSNVNVAAGNMFATNYPRAPQRLPNSPSLGETVDRKVRTSGDRVGFTFRQRGFTSVECSGQSTIFVSNFGCGNVA